MHETGEIKFWGHPATEGEVELVGIKKRKNLRANRDNHETWRCKEKKGAHSLKAINEGAKKGKRVLQG